MMPCNNYCPAKEKTDEKKSGKERKRKEKVDGAVSLLNLETI